ncbi:response regulator transcription factor [Candidatus Saccharibacteria bacterium]|nr:MAG: response regulator transcription factor [Candidatus Saccharibacteria bacterium]
MNPSNDSKKIIIVEDNTALAEIYKTRLELLGYTCFVAYNGITGLYFIQKEIPDLVLLDLMIPDISGGQLLATMRGTDWGKNIPVYVISNLNETEAPKDLRDLGISGYSVKAMMTEDTVDRIVNGILRPDMQQEPISAPDTPPAGATLADVPFHEAPQ